MLFNKLHKNIKYSLLQFNRHDHVGLPWMALRFFSKHLINKIIHKYNFMDIMDSYFPKPPLLAPVHAHTHT